ncbi:MAG: hypothetical protein BWK77_04455 [Verrucomicrobia bacterium A1]|nr:MAG: hypothetical protein BWK77_04455 [Verrucomicrobia bacterium A1]
MQRTLIVVLAAVSLCITAAQAQEPAAAPAPKLVCDEPTFNFGEMDNSKDVEHTFLLKNEGTLTLEIGQVRASCGCTVASTSQKTVPPGQTTEVSARLSLRGRQGPQHKTITVQSNDPQQPNFMLALEGSAISEMQIRPNQLFFGRIASGTIVTGLVELAIESTNAVNILKSEANTPQLAVTTEISADGKLHRIWVTTQPPLSKGTLRGNVHIETDHPKYPAMDIVVSAFVVSDLSFAPEEIAVVGQTNQPMARFVIVRSETGKAFQVETVEPPLPTIQANIVPMDATSYRIELANIIAAPDLDGKVVRIKTTMEGSQEILIPFRVIPSPETPPPQ